MSDGKCELKLKSYISNSNSDECKISRTNVHNCSIYFSYQTVVPKYEQNMIYKYNQSKAVMLCVNNIK